LYSEEQKRSREAEECIQKCLDCQRICLQSSDYRWRWDGGRGPERDATPLLNCAEICRTAALLLLRGSEFSPRVCALCAEVCEGWVRDCELTSGAENLKSCIQASRECAESCRRIANGQAVKGQAVNDQPVNGQGMNEPRDWAAGGAASPA
jgi:hypothetical protein